MRPAEIIDKFDLRPCMAVADFGCGAGYFVLLIARKVGKCGVVYAVDILQSALDSVRSNAKLHSILNIETIKADLEKPNGSKIAANSMDIVLMANILFQVRDKVTTINEAKRVLKKNGKIIILEWVKDSACGPLKDLRISKEEMKALAKKEGLTLEKEFDAGGNHYGLMFSL